MPKLVTLNVENQPCKSLSYNPMHYSNTNHFVITLVLISDLCEKNVLNLEYTPTSQQPADIFTKSSGKTKFVGCREIILGNFPQ